jgi:hypothetical protein
MKLPLYEVIMYHNKNEIIHSNAWSGYSTVQRGPQRRVLSFPYMVHVGGSVCELAYGQINQTYRCAKDMEYLAEFAKALC